MRYAFDQITPDVRRFIEQLRRPRTLSGGISDASALDLALEVERLAIKANDLEQKIAFLYAALERYAGLKPGEGRRMFPYDEAGGPDPTGPAGRAARRG